MNRVKSSISGIGPRITDSLRMKETNSNLVNQFGTHQWSNQDLDPVPVERRNWTTWTFASYWLSEGWGASPWSVGSSMVSGGLLWYHAFIACIIGHGLGSVLTVWNGRGGSIYHIGWPIWMRATFGPWGSIFPIVIRCILDLVWFSIQTYFGGLFLDIVFQCIFGHAWTNIPNGLPEAAGTTTRALAAYFIYWLIQLPLCFFRPHELRWLLAFKGVTIPVTCFGLFIWGMVRSGGPGNFAISGTKPSSKVLAWSIVGAINAAINGEFGPLVASEPDITRYAKTPRAQIVGQLLVAPWAATLVALLGIITAACTEKIYGTALWNPALILEAILAENNDPKTKFAVFLCAFTFMFGQLGTNYVANLIPFGVDFSSLAPRYINITRAQLVCALIGGWALVPWKVLVSGTVFIQCVTGMGIFMGDLVGIMLADYFFVRKGNYFIEDLYTSDPNGRYWYFHGWHWRAYAAYLVGIVLPLPGLLGVLGVKSLAGTLNPASQIYSLGYLTSFLSSMVVYTAICKISPPKHVAEARSMPFEAMGEKDVLLDNRVFGEDRSDSQDVSETKVDMQTKV